MPAPTPEDRARQTRCLREYASRFGLTFWETSDKKPWPCHFDALAYLRGIPYQIVEFKGRAKRHDEFVWKKLGKTVGDVFTRVDKTNWLEEVCDFQGLPGYVLMEYDDGLFGIELERIPRHDIRPVPWKRARDDYEGEEDGYYFPCTLLTRIR